MAVIQMTPTYFELRRRCLSAGHTQAHPSIVPTLNFPTLCGN
jgi:hypothetical protein